MTKDEVLKQALEALEDSSDEVWNEYLSDWRHGVPTRKAQLDGKLKMCEDHDKAIAAIKAALAQPAQEPWLLESTQTLAKTVAREFYPEVTQWECLNDLAGVISQIDNMTTGLMRKPKQEPEQWQKRHPLRTQGKWENTNEPDAKWWQDNAQGWDIRALFTSPPKRQPLTEDQLDALALDDDGLPNSHLEFARAIEQAHGIGDNT